MINITPFAKPIYLLNEEIKLVATGNNLLITVGSKASINLIFTSLAVNDYFMLIIDGTTYRFEAVAEPDDSGLQITAGNNIQTILNDLRSNFLLYKNYTLTANAQVINIRAKSIGSIFTIITDFTHSPNVSASDNIPGTNDIINDNYGILYSLEEKDNTNNYNELTSFISNGLNTIEILIDQFLKKISWPYQLPSFTQSVPIKRSDLIRVFRVKLSERFGKTPEAKKLYTTAVFSVLRIELPGVLSPDFDLHTWFTNSKRFLSDLPIFRRIWFNAPVFLTFINPLEGINDFKVTVSYIDSAYDTIKTTAFLIITSSQNDIYQIPVSPLALKLPVDTIQYSLQIDCLTAPYIGVLLINPITFKVIDQTDYGRAFIFLNSYGAWETLLSFASMKTDLKTTRVNLLNQNIISSIVDSQLATYEVSTGAITPAEALSLQDFLASEQIYLSGSNNFIPIVIEAGSFIISDEFEDFVSVKFRYIYADKRLRDNQFNPDETYFEKVGFTSNFQIN